MKKLFTLLTFVSVLMASQVQGASFCDSPLTDADIDTVFRQSAINQLSMEFGKQHLALSNVSHSPVSADLMRVEADVKYRRPGSTEPTSMRIIGWVSRCTGTTMVRRQTWLADGTLSVPRFTSAQLSGEGITIGKPNAPIHLIAFIDSRCPNCHRLISYAIERAKTGQLFLELRQVAYLETEDEALQDARLFETRLVQGAQAVLDDATYLEYVGGFTSEEPVDKQSEPWLKAKKLLQNNIRIARKVLHITAVPGVLVQEKDHDNKWRMLGYWELNRMMQPDL